MKFFSRKKTPKVPLPIIRDGSLVSIQRNEDENKIFSDAYKHIIQESMDATVAPLLSIDNSSACEQFILDESENTTEQSSILPISQPPSEGRSFETSDEAVHFTQTDTTTLLYQRKKKEILVLVKGIALLVLFYGLPSFLWDFLSSVLLLLVGFAGGYFYLLISNIFEDASFGTSTMDTFQDVEIAASEGAITAEMSYRETIANNVSLEPCFEAARDAYQQFHIANNFSLTSSNTEELRYRISDAFAGAMSNEIMRVNNRKLQQNY